MATRRDTTAHQFSNGGSRRCRYLLLLSSLSVLFALRILAQAIQRWVPQSFLPDFAKFQGSNMPYWLLLSMQLVILTLMVGVTIRAAVGGSKGHERVARILAWVGGIYMLGAVARITVGLAWAEAPAWFTAWISAVFHVVLAAFVLTLAACYATGKTRSDEEVAS